MQEAFQVSARHFRLVSAALDRDGGNLLGSENEHESAACVRRICVKNLQEPSGFLDEKSLAGTRSQRMDELRHWQQRYGACRCCSNQPGADRSGSPIRTSAPPRSGGATPCGQE
jgi:hypothetical protein